jgi:hypothetical protein
MDNLDKTQTWQRKWYDKKTLQDPEDNTLEEVAHSRANIADKVMLYRQNIKTKRLTERLDDKLFGPFVLK